MTSSFLPSTLHYDQMKSLIQFGTFKPRVIRFQQKIVTTGSQNKKEHVEDDRKEWIVVARREGRQTNPIQTKLYFHQKHAKRSISHKNRKKKHEDVEA